VFLGCAVDSWQLPGKAGYRFFVKKRRKKLSLFGDAGRAGRQAYLRLVVKV
jgi:hypothetical protein